MILQNANLAIRFLLELCVLAALGNWGFHIERGILFKIGFGIGAPLLIAVVWGMFGSPQASMPLHGPSHLILEIVVFGLAAAALYASQHPVLSIVFLLIAIINRILMYIWNQ